MEQRNMIDTEIDICIKKIANGDKEALKCLYEDMVKPMYFFALSLMKNPSNAEDIVQDTFLKIWENSGKYISSGKPKAWIFTIARNLSLSEIKKRNRIYEKDISDISHEKLCTIQDKEEFIQNEEIDRLLGILNSDERKIVTLHAICEFPHKETAKILKMPYAKVRWKYAYAIKKLNKHLTKEQINLQKENIGI